jgi:hypothetical protein
MLFATIGAIFMVVLFSRLQDRRIKRLEDFRESIIKGMTEPLSESSDKLNW